MRDIYSNNVVPPTCGKSVFSGVKTANCRLHVPVGSKEEYAFADGWCDFYNILEGEGEGESELEKLKAANEELKKENEALKQEIACYSLGDLNKDGRTDIDDVAALLGLDAYSSDSDALAMLTEGTCITPAEIQEKYGDVEYYTVEGVKVAEPSQNGIYIVKKIGVTKMIVVKK